jgi:hypothetical protein
MYGLKPVPFKEEGFIISEERVIVEAITLSLLSQICETISFDCRTKLLSLMLPVVLDLLCVLVQYAGDLRSELN